MTKLKLECPVCETGYTPARLGITIPDDPTKVVKATIVCVLCHASFDVRIATDVIDRIERPVGWFARYVLRRQPTIETVSGLLATSSPRSG